ERHHEGHRPGRPILGREGLCCERAGDHDRGKRSLPHDAVSFPIVAAQSALTPLALIGAAHFSISLRTNLPSHSGERSLGAATVAPRPSSRCFTDAVSIAATIAALTFFTTASGVPLGMNTALQV